MSASGACISRPPTLLLFGISSAITPAFVARLKGCRGDDFVPARIQQKWTPVLHPDARES